MVTCAFCVVELEDLGGRPKLIVRQVVGKAHSPFVSCDVRIIDTGYVKATCVCRTDLRLRGRELHRFIGLLR